MPCSTRTLALDGSSGCTAFFTIFAGKSRKADNSRNGTMRVKGLEIESVNNDAGNSGLFMQFVGNEDGIYYAMQEKDKTLMHGDVSGSFFSVV